MRISGFFYRFRLCSFMLSFIISSKLVIFVLLYYIVTFNLAFFTHYILLVPYVYISIESIDCISWSSFELKVILLVSSVKTLCPFLLNICCVFDISLLDFYEFFMKKKNKKHKHAHKSYQNLFEEEKWKRRQILSRAPQKSSWR